MKYVLASASPRRIELLRQIVPEFEVVAADIDESVLPGESPWETAERLALEKAVRVAGIRPEEVVIAGDTVVAIGQERYLQLAKPADAGEARFMLRELSGREHLVITGIAVVGPFGSQTATETTRVTFRAIARSEIEAYVATGEPMDKAGAYAIQGGAESFVERVEGSMSNVVGLPLEALSDLLGGSLKP